MDFEPTDNILILIERVQTTILRFYYQYTL